MARSGTSLVILLFITAFVKSQDENQLSVISACICSGAEATYTCSVRGGGNTIWNGSAFNCPSTGSSNNNQILLRHSGFGTQMGSCNNGDITGKGIFAMDTLFVSQLNVTLSSDVVGKEIACYYDDNIDEILIGNATIILTTEDGLSSPTNLTVIKVTHDELVFNWMPVTHRCTTSYIIDESGCGNCPMRVNNTNANCSIQVLPNQQHSCLFRVRAVICDDVQGEPSNFTVLTLSVPEVPVLTSVIPKYFQNKSLESISVTFMAMQTTSISDTISGSPEYTVIYRNLSSSICYFSKILPNNCVTGICMNTFDVHLSDCSVSDDINVEIFATNILGNGSSSRRVAIDGFNDFVNIKYEDNIITCTFMNDVTLRNEKVTLLCKIEYMPCKSVLSGIKINGTLSTRNMNELIIQLVFQTSEWLEYCYTVTASNGTFTIDIRGKFFEGLITGSVSNNNAIIGSVIAVFIVILLALVLIIIILWRNMVISQKKRYHIYDEPDNIELTQIFDDVVEVDSDKFEFINVDKNCEVTTLMKEKNLPYKKGCVYYQFTRKDEKITSDKIIIFMNNGKKLFESSKAQRKYLVTDGVMTRKPNFKHHTVFVQSKGVGARPLFKGTLLLYDIELSKRADIKEEKMPDPVDPSRDIEKIYVPKVCSLIELIEEKGLKFRSGCAFFEFTHKQEDIGSDKEVILMSMTEGEKLFTGEGARHLVIGDKSPRGVPKPDNLPDWRVFIQSRHLGSRHLDAKSYILYEKPKPDDVEFETVSEGSFIQLPVHKDCQLRDFIDEHPDVKEYKDLTEFYFEFTSKAEFISEDKGVILMNKESKLFTGDKAKEMIGAPNRRVNNPHLKHYRVFVQDGGAGTRLLKAKSIVLYKKNKLTVTVESRMIDC